METIKQIMRKPLVGGVTVGLVAAGIAVFLIYKRYA